MLYCAMAGFLLQTFQLTQSSSILWILVVLCHLMDNKCSSLHPSVVYFTQSAPQH